MANLIKLSRSPISVGSYRVNGADYAILTLVLYTGTNTNRIEEYTYSLRMDLSMGQNPSFDISQYVYDMKDYSNSTNNTLWYAQAAITQYNYNGSYLSVSTVTSLVSQGFRTLKDPIGESVSSNSVGFLQTNKVVYWDGRISLNLPLFLDNTGGRSLLVNGVAQGGYAPSTDSRYIVPRYSRTTFVSGREDFTIGLSDGTNLIDEVLVKALPSDFCKYEPMAIDFVNRYGIVQRIHVGAKHSKSVNVTKEEYFKNPSFSMGYITSDNQYQDFNVNGRMSTQVNTGYVSEDYNEVIKELLLSEHVWIVPSTGGTLPVKPVTSSLQYKTRVTDKNINFTLDLLHTYDEVITR